MNLTPSACASLKTIGLTKAKWYRAIQPHFLPTALHTKHTRRIRSRFSNGSTSKPSYRILYLAETHLVALFEVQALLGSPTIPGGVVPKPHGAWTILDVNISLTRIADLTDVTEQGKLATNAQELTGDWRGYHLRGPYTSVKHPSGIPAPTQELGEALLRQGLEGFLTLSAKLPENMILVLFPKNLQSSSTITFYDPASKKTYPLI